MRPRERCRAAISRTLLGSTFLALLILPACGTGGGGGASQCDTAPSTGAANLAVTFHQQHTEEWCWAAVSSAVTDYFRGVMGQDCQFLSAYFYGLADVNQCCAQPILCNRPALSMSEIQYALSNVGNIASIVANGPLSEAALQRELANGRPVVAGLTSTFSGHVILIVGYGPAGYHIQDPFFGEFYNVPYGVILANPQLGVWSTSLYGLSRAEDSCAS